MGYFRYEGVIVPIADPDAVSKAFRAFLSNNGVLDDFISCINDYAGGTIEDYTKSMSTEGRGGMINSFTWSGSYHGTNVYSRLDGEWSTIFSERVAPDFIIEYKTGGDVINCRRVAPC